MRRVNRSLEEYVYNEAASALYQFTWHELCDWYLEIAKPRLADPGASGEAARGTALFVLRRVLALLHPIMPFVTEEIASRLPGGGTAAGALGVPRGRRALAGRRRGGGAGAGHRDRLRGAQHPRRDERQAEPPGDGRARGGPRGEGGARRARDRHASAGSPNAAELRVNAGGEAGESAVAPLACGVLRVPLAGLVDFQAELRRLDKELAKIDTDAAFVEKKLARPDFVANAPAEVVAKDRRRLEELREKRALLAAGRERVLRHPRRRGGGVSDYALARDLDRLIRAALDEDLPAHDVTTARPRPRGAGGGGGLPRQAGVHGERAGRGGARLRARRPRGRVPAAGARRRDASRAGTELARVVGERRLAPGGGAHRAQPAAAARRHRHGDPRGSSTPWPGSRAWSSTRARPPRAGGSSRRPPCATAAASNHRFSLSDGVLDQGQPRAPRRRASPPAVAAARARTLPGTRIEVEAATLDEVEAALAAGADVVLLDNADPALARAAVRLVAGRAVLELSGGITAENARAMAASGADCISSGALTHSAPAVDISLEFL